MEKYAGLLKNRGIIAANITHHAIHFEALSRGLSVSIKNKKNIKYADMFYSTDELGQLFSISNGNDDHLLNNVKVVKASKNINLLKKENISNTLQNNGFNFIDKVKFGLNDLVSMDEVFKKLKKPLVVKPINGTMGNGVYCNIVDEVELRSAINKQNSDFMIEEYISDADEYRVYTINSKAVAFCKRLTPKVIGDGVKNLEELVLEKNKNRLALKLSKIKLSDHLDLSYIPQQGEEVVLSLVKGRSSGSEIEVIKSGLDLGVITEIERFAKIFEENLVLGFDILVKDGALYILEVNTRPQISSAILPDIGDGIDFPKILLDALFGISEVVTPKFSEFLNSYNTLSRKLEFDWKEIQYQMKDGELVKNIIL